MNTERNFLLLLIGIFTLLSAFLVLPFLPYILTAILLAYVLHPLQVRLTPRIGSQLSAIALIVVAVFAILLPLWLLIDVVLEQALTVVRAIREGELEVDFTAIEEGAQTYVGADVSISETIRSVTQSTSETLLGNLVGIFGSVSDVVIGLSILLFVLYYLLKDGGDFVRWLEKTTPMPPDVQNELSVRIDRLMWAVLVGNVVVATVQGVLTGIGLAIAGISAVVFWTFMTAVLSLLPLIGASVVWIPASLYLLATEQYVAGGFLLVYGSVIVSVSDNYLRPLISGHEAKLNPGLFILGIFGGIYLFGFMGIFFGPIVLGVLQALLDVFAREYAH